MYVFAPVAEIIRPYTAGQSEWGALPRAVRVLVNEHSCTYERADYPWAPALPNLLWGLLLLVFHKPIGNVRLESFSVRVQLQRFFVNRS